MSTGTARQRISRSGGRHQSLFYRDLASPVSSHRASGLSGRFVSSGQAAPLSVQWRENFSAGSDPPPPPVFTLEDRVDFSPEPGFAESPATPRTPGTPPPPTSPVRSRSEAGGSPVTSSWWSPVKSGGGGDRGESSPVDGVLQSGALLALPPPQGVVTPEVERNAALPVRVRDEEEWVTVFGFSPIDTNLVLREFEKYGVVLKHIPGPKGANWIHILYQSGYDAQRALKKDGLQLNSTLIVGVKPVDPSEREILDEKLKSSTDGGFKVLVPPHPAAGKSLTARSPFAATPYHLQKGTAVTGNSSRQPSGAIALPARSIVSKVVDLVFGI